MHCVDFAENIQFGRYGIICPPGWLATHVSLNKKHTNGSWHDYK